MSIFEIPRPDFFDADTTYRPLTTTLEAIEGMRRVGAGEPPRALTLERAPGGESGD